MRRSSEIAVFQFLITQPDRGVVMMPSRREIRLRSLNFFITCSCLADAETVLIRERERVLPLRSAIT